MNKVEKCLLLDIKPYYKAEGNKDNEILVQG